MWCEIKRIVLKQMHLRTHTHTHSHSIIESFGINFYESIHRTNTLLVYFLFRQRSFFHWVNWNIRKWMNKSSSISSSIEIHLWFPNVTIITFHDCCCWLARILLYLPDNNNNHATKQRMGTAFDVEKVHRKNCYDVFLFRAGFFMSSCHAFVREPRRFKGWKGAHAVFACECLKPFHGRVHCWTTSKVHHHHHHHIAVDIIKRKSSLRLCSLLHCIWLPLALFLIPFSFIIIWTAQTNDVSFVSFLVFVYFRCRYVHLHPHTHHLIYDFLKTFSKLVGWKRHRIEQSSSVVQNIDRCTNSLQFLPGTSILSAFLMQTPIF